MFRLLELFRDFAPYTCKPYQFCYNCTRKGGATFVTVSPLFQPAARWSGKAEICHLTKG